eukprot:UN04783
MEQLDGCVQKCTGFHQSYGWTRHSCDLCNYDLCDGCLVKYGKVKIVRLSGQRKKSPSPEPPSADFQPPPMSMIKNVSPLSAVDESRAMSSDPVKDVRSPLNR